MPSTIEWTDETWNPVVGCSKIAAGCKNCYAERMAWRLACMEIAGYKKVATDLGWRGNVALRNYVLDKPLHWRKPRRVFVCSMGDLFHKNVPFGYIDKQFGVCALCPQHKFLILTKRPERMLEYYQQEPRGQIDHAVLDGIAAFAGRAKPYAGKGLTRHLRDKDCLWPLSNVWLGVSCSGPDDLWMIETLVQIPAAVRFVSLEPLLGPIDLWPFFTDYFYCTGCKTVRNCTKGLPQCCGHWKSRSLDQVIVGGESGPGARPMHPQWVRDLRDQCIEAQVPFFFKQWGEWLPDQFIGLGDSGKRQHTVVPLRPGPAPAMSGACGVTRVGKKKAGRVLDGRTWDEYPKLEARATDKDAKAI